MTKPSIDTLHFHRVRSVFFFGLIAVFSIAFLYVLHPIVYPIFWAAIIAIMFYPVYRSFTSMTGMQTASAIITIVLAVVVIFLPLSLLVVLIFQQSVLLYTSLSGGHFFIDVQGIATWLQHSPFAPYIDSIKSEWTNQAADASKFIATFLFQNLRSITQNSVSFIFFLFITLYALFFFLRDGERILRRLQHLSPLEDRHDVLLFKRFVSTVRATLKGTLIIGGIQGLLGGLLFWITGVEGAIIWGVIMFFLSMVPGLGAFLVWLPAGVIMLALGNTWQGIVIIIFGAVIISTIDNFLRPPLVGKNIEIHPLLVLFSTLGGIFLFGIPGVIIGPTIAALYLSIISIYDTYYLHELKRNGL